MHRRDLLRVALSLLAGTGVQSILDAIASTAIGVARQFGGEDTDADDEADATATRTAVVDSIEGDTAVVTFEDGAGTRTVAANVLPPAAREEGMVLRVPRGDALAIAQVDRVATARRRDAASDRFDDLATRPPGTEDGSAPDRRSTP